MKVIQLRTRVASHFALLFICLNHRLRFLSYFQVFVLFLLLKKTTCLSFRSSLTDIVALLYRDRRASFTLTRWR